MSIQQRTQSSLSVSAGPRRDDATRQGTEPGNARGTPAAERHGYPRRQPGTGYGHSSGYATRDSYSGSGRYIESAPPALFRFH